MKTPIGDLLNDLAAIRQASGMTQQQVGDIIGISRSAVNRFENSVPNGHAPNLATVMRYAEIVGATIQVKPAEIDWDATTQGIETMLDNIDRKHGKRHA